MAQDNNIENNAQELKHGVEQGARDVKTVAAATTKAASGNVAGAAVEVAKNPHVIAGVLKVIGVLGLMLLIVALCIPSMIWSQAEGFVNTAVSYTQDQWDLSSHVTGNKLVDATNAPSAFITNVIGDLFIKGWGLVTASTDSGEASKENLTTAGLEAASKEDALKETIGTMNGYTLRRYADRYNALIDEIKADSKQRAGKYYKYTMNVSSPLGLGKEKITDPTVIYESMQRESLKLMSAYSVQTDSELGDKVKYQTYSDWLGAESFWFFDRKTTRLTGWLVDTCDWRGTFFSQPVLEYKEYVEQELEQNVKYGSGANVTILKEVMTEKSWNQMWNKINEFGDSATALLLFHDPAGPNVNEYYIYTINAEGEEEAHLCADVTYTIQTATMQDVVDNVCEFHDGYRSVKDDEAILKKGQEESIKILEKAAKYEKTEESKSLVQKAQDMFNKAFAGIQFFFR